MPIRPFLAGQAFEPEVIQVMSAVLSRACDTLGVRMIDCPDTRLVAKEIIELTQRGVRDPDTLLSMVLATLQTRASSPRH